MAQYNIVRADSVMAGARGWAVTDQNGQRIAPLVLGHYLSYNEARDIAHQRTTAETPIHQRRTSGKAQAGAGHARHQKDADRIDGYDRDDLGESPDY